VLRQLPAQLAATAVELGEVSVTTRNQHMALAHVRAYPNLQPADDANWGCADDRTLLADFSRWNRMIARWNLLAPGYASGIEIHDDTGVACHAIRLTEESNRPHYTSLLDLDELGLAAVAEKPRSAGASLSAPWHQQLSQRSAWLATLPSTTARRVEPSALPGLLHLVLMEELHLRMQVFTPAAVQSAPFQPTAIEVRRDSIRGAFAAGGFSMQLSGIGHLWLVAIDCPCCDRTKWTLEAYESKGTTLAAWSCADPESELHWRDLVTASFLDHKSATSGQAGGLRE